MATSDIDDTTVAWFVARREEQAAAHHGAALRTWAEAAVRALPIGPLTLVSTSSEGSALAAVISALRDQPTRWQTISLGRPPAGLTGAVAVIEAVQLGDGARASIAALLPHALVLDGLAASHQATLRKAA